MHIKCVYACLFGCKDVTDRLGHYIECPMMFSPWKFMHRDLSIHATDRWGLNSPNKHDILHICCVFSAYHATSAHVKQDHETYGTADQTKQFLIQSQRRTWSIFAEAYEATARDFELSCPRYTLTAILHWRLNYEGPKLNVDDLDLSQDPLILCPVTAAPSNVVDLTQDPLGPHHFLAIVQTPEAPSPPGFDSACIVW